MAVSVVGMCCDASEGCFWCVDTLEMIEYEDDSCG